MTDETKTQAQDGAGHTPGPWEIDESGGQWWIYGAHDGRCTVGVAKCDLMVNAALNICKQQNVIGQGMPDEEKMANAHLIAAAPALLEALRAVVDCPYPTPDNLKDAARAALAKAEGKQEE